MTTDHTNDGTFTRDEVSQAMDYAREHGDSRIVDDEGVTRLSFHVPHLGDPPHEPGCNCGESSECPTYAPGVPTLTPEAPPAREPGPCICDEDYGYDPNCPRHGLPDAKASEAPSVQVKPARRVIVETPYAGDVATNLTYLRACMRDCLLRGEAPFASHGLYTQDGVLRDDVPDERKHGIEAGFAWREAAEATVVYTDLGVSTGMEYGITHATRIGHAVERRTLANWPPDAKPTEPPPLPAGWHWLPKLQGYAKTLDEEDSDWVRVYLEGEDVVAEVQADENQRIEVPADVLRHLLGLTAPAADVRALEAAVFELNVFLTIYKNDNVSKALALLTGKGAP